MKKSMTNLYLFPLLKACKSNLFGTIGFIDRKTNRGPHCTLQAWNSDMEDETPKQFIVRFVWPACNIAAGADKPKDVQIWAEG